MDLSVVIPARNEAENVTMLVTEIDAALGGLLDYEIVFVDDGSTDDMLSVLKGLQETRPHLRVIRHAESCGQSTAVRSGVRGARAAWIATLDGDGQNDPGDIPALWRLLQEHADRPDLDMIAGIRRKRQDSWVKRYSSRFANKVRRKLLRDPAVDTGCGLKLMRRERFLDLPYFDHMHRYLPALFQRHGGALLQVEVNHRPRNAGRSNYGTIDRLLVGITDLLGVMWLQRRTRLPTLIDDV